MNAASPMRRGIFDEFLIDRIYEAAVVPELWPALLHELAELTDAEGGLMFAIARQSTGWTASERLKPLFETFIRDGWQERNQRPARMMAVREPAFLSDDMLFTPDEIAADRFYQEFLHQNGLGHAVGTLIENPNGDTILLSLERSRTAGPVPRAIVEDLDAIRPHLARSTIISARLGFERAYSRTEILQALGLAGGALDSCGRLLVANDLLNALVPHTIQDSRMRIVLNEAAADGLLETALTRLRVFGAMDVMSIPLPAREERPPLIVHLLPVRGNAQDIFSRADVLIVVTPVDQGAVPNARVLQGLFDLTPAEARVAAAIGEGQTIAAIAAASRVSRETVRSHLKSLLGKVGVGRQVDLVRLLAGSALPR